MFKNFSPKLFIDDNGSEIKKRSKIFTKLLTIGVVPCFRGKGVAKTMTCFFLNCLRKDKVEKVGLSVEKNNASAISFYKKAGWKVRAFSEEYVSFYRVL